MTAAIAHHLPQRLPMSPITANTRRLSARLQQKEASQTHADDGDATKESSKVPAPTGTRKRKAEYEENDDGFAFSRVKKTKKTKADTEANPQTTVIPVQNEAKPRATTSIKPATPSKSGIEPKKRRHKMSFSTPKISEERPQRRSKRLSDEVKDRSTTPPPANEQKLVREKRQVGGQTKHQKADQEPVHGLQTSTAAASTTPKPSSASSEDPAATKIALPVSDTPVIRRNKAMREGRGSRGERRSSLGLRGRRASSLIDTGNSNALPHTEVAISDFFKHIESDQIETRRMRQLLTWCATRAMHAKPQGSEFDDTHKIMSARAIEEELLKELSNRSDLSDWFTREDVPVPVAELPQRPNPKNSQNTNKIAELEQRIQRLRLEKDALEALLRPPSVAVLPKPPNKVEMLPSRIDKTLLDEGDTAALDLLQTGALYSKGITDRINNITSSLGPVVDTFADGIHKVAQYRTAADGIAGRVLSICAQQLAHRDREGRKKALQSNNDRVPAQDMSSVLRGLSRVDR